MNTDSFLIENDFPHSMKLDEYLKRIEEYPEIGVIVRDGYTIIQYNVAFPETFKSEYAREARGLIFDNKTKEVIRRPFHKFFNVNEKEHTQIEDLSKDDIIYVANKLDGTLIAPFIVFREVIWGTKRVASAYHEAVESFLYYGLSRQARFEYIDFVHHCIECGLTPLFEFHDPAFSGSVIVIRYEKAFLKLIGLRDMETGMYIDISDPMVFGSIKENFPEIETVELLDKKSLLNNQKELEDSTGIEGRVIML